MFDGYQMDIPQAWESIQLDGLKGTILIVGGTDTGKSTFARYLCRRLRSLNRKVAFLDGDPGQSTLGPPTTITLVCDIDLEDVFSTGNKTRRYFVGCTTPQGHMLSILVGAARLVQVAKDAGAEVILYDTTGMIDVQQGGVALKNAKIDLLRPTSIFAFQRQQELEPLLTSLRRSHRTQVLDMQISMSSMPRDHVARKEHRANQFSHYFSQAKLLLVNWTNIAVFPFPLFRINRLVALEDANGFTLGLGIVRRIDRSSRKVMLLSTRTSLSSVNALRLGDILLDPDTFQDERIV
jgi:polynucleotide 5'-hydroxyl-kinase GRC3/NOL9